MPQKAFVQRDISWLSFNSRVLQEAADTSVPLRERIRFLGIFSNNMDEFFRVRVATLKRMVELDSKGANFSMHPENSPTLILTSLLKMVLKLQLEFDRIWAGMQRELNRNNIYLKTDKQLSKDQKAFIIHFFEKDVRASIIPLMIESLPELPYLRDKSIYLGVVMQYKQSTYNKQYALIEVPSKSVGRFIQLPSPANQTHIILLEDVIRVNLPYIFSYFGYDHFDAHLFKVTKDAEIDLDSDISTTLVEKMQKGLKGRRKGKPVRFVYDKEMDQGLLKFLIRKLHIDQKSSIIPGGRIHNFRHFMDFPDLFPASKKIIGSFVHPELKNVIRVTDVILKRDVMLHFPYHSFDSIIDLLREAAMDPEVFSIKITAYRLAAESKIINALINASRNGKRVEVMLELKARFDEEANIEWKNRLEEEGVKVLLGLPNMKVHAKLCLIQKKFKKRTMRYGFVSTGNLNENTAAFYGDHCLLTSADAIMNDIGKIFRYLEDPSQKIKTLLGCKKILVSPVDMRKRIQDLIEREIEEARKGNPARIILKLNSISDTTLIEQLHKAVQAGVKVDLIVRGIYCAKKSTGRSFAAPRAISIVDQYLEHARVMVFHHAGKVLVYISSADWMVRNLDHRIEAAIPITDLSIKEELLDLLNIQLNDNVKARVLDYDLKNAYVSVEGKKLNRSQHMIHQYLYKKQQVYIRDIGSD